MSDMSTPQLTLMPLEGQLPLRRAERERERGEPFAWPTPSLPSYPAPTCQMTPEPCEIEGLNGHLMSGRLLAFNPEEGALQVLVPPSRSAITLKFSQFRRLRLLLNLAPLPLPAGAADEETQGVLTLRPAVPFRIELHGAPALEGLTVCPLRTEQGIYLFEPADVNGAVRRSFVPCSAYQAADLGVRIGEALVEQHATTTEQVESALNEQQHLRTQKLGDILVTRQIISADELVSAIEQQARMPLVRIGEALIALGFITPVQLDDALAQQRTDRGVPLGELLVRRGDVSRQDLQTALARKMGYPMVDVTQFPADMEAVARLPYPVANRLRALPLLHRAGRLIVAVEDPSRGDAMEELEFAAQGKVVPVLARAALLHGAIDRAYEKMGTAVFAPRLPDPAAGVDFDADNAKGLLATLEQQHTSEQRGSGDEEASIEQSDNSLVRLINSMIIEAHGQGVSDIHIECQPGREKVRIRFRRDGQLKPYLELPHTYRSALIARLKIMCDLDISERRKPQDGKINFGKFVQGQKLELRVATIPTTNNLEDAVMRLLASAKPIPLDNLNLSPSNLKRFKEAAQRPYGMLLCVGPTGSGKTTTLHSALGYINVPNRKLWTAEDPIEITQPGLRQVQVNPKIDWTFAKALRSFLRADPDVIMVGEIRDRETAQVAIEASLTGHLVMSTLHTNSAPETVTRLLDMGMDPFNFADALLGVLAQRLVRRLCSHCRVGHDATAEEVEELLRDHLHAMRDVDLRPSEGELMAEWQRRFGTEGRITLYRTVGCDRCDGTGYRGRAGIHELMMVTPGLRHLIQTGARAEELQRHALGDGMRTLRQDGIEKVLAGVTTIEEVRASSNA